MNDTLKAAGRIGAELGAAKAENEKLRGLLRTAWRLRPDHDYHDEHLQAEQKAWEVEAAEVLNAAGALPKQPEPVCQTMQRPKAECGCPDCGSSLIDWPTAEPTDTYTAVYMATAAAQGFRDGQAAVEQAAAQDVLWAVHAQGPDELYAAFSRADAEQHAAALNALPMPDDIHVSAVVIVSPWSAAEHWKYLAEQEREHATGLRAFATRPAQTEQPATVKDSLTVQPMAYAVFAANGNVVCFSTQRDHPSLVALESEGKSVVSLSPIAQTAPQPEQSGLVDTDSEKLRGLVQRYINLFADVPLAGEAKLLDAESRAALSAQWTAEQ